MNNSASVVFYPIDCPLNVIDIESKSQLGSVTIHSVRHAPITKPSDCSALFETSLAAATPT